VGITLALREGIGNTKRTWTLRRRQGPPFLLLPVIRPRGCAGSSDKSGCPFNSTILTLSRSLAAQVSRKSASYSPVALHIGNRELSLQEPACGTPTVRGWFVPAIHRAQLNTSLVIAGTTAVSARPLPMGGLRYRPPGLDGDDRPWAFTLSEEPFPKGWVSRKPAQTTGSSSCAWRASRFSAGGNRDSRGRWQTRRRRG
jgi:hypothetical protein